MNLKYIVLGTSKVRFKRGLNEILIGERMIAPIKVGLKIKWNILHQLANLTKLLKVRALKDSVRPLRTRRVRFIY